MLVRTLLYEVTVPENNAHRVLILDDERVIVDVICMILNQSGFEARGVYTHQTAILAAHEFKPDVLLTGFVNCCEKNGCETAEEVLTFLPDCRIIVFSGQAATADFVDDFNRRGYAFELRAKPIHPQDLLTLLRGPRGAPFVLEPRHHAPESPLPVEPIRRILKRFQGLFRRRNLSAR